MNVSCCLIKTNCYCPQTRHPGQLCSPSSIHPFKAHSAPLELYEMKWIAMERACKWWTKQLFRAPLFAKLNVRASPWSWTPNEASPFGLIDWRFPSHPSTTKRRRHSRRDGHFGRARWKLHLGDLVAGPGPTPAIGQLASGLMRFLGKDRKRGWRPRAYVLPIRKQPWASQLFCLKGCSREKRPFLFLFHSRVGG